MLALFVNIPYLRVRLKPLGDSFSLRLSGLRLIEYSDYENKIKTSSLADTAVNGIEILSTESKGMPVKIETTMGILTLDFDSLEIRLDTGQIVAYETVLAACEAYWDEWSASVNQMQTMPGKTSESG